MKECIDLPLFQFVGSILHNSDKDNGKIGMETIGTYKLFARQFTLKWNVTSGNNWLGKHEIEN